MNTLKAEKRSLDVKAKRLRREGYVVGNVFGREMKESIPVKMVKRDVEKLLKTDHNGSRTDRFDRVPGTGQQRESSFRCRDCPCKS